MCCDRKRNLKWDYVRAEFEEKSKVLFERVVNPVDQVLLAANISASNLHKVTKKSSVVQGWS
jgi:molecular chaperone DnaK (HSP70)